MSRHSDQLCQALMQLVMQAVTPSPHKHCPCWLAVIILLGEMAMHFIEKYGMMAIRIPSKFDMRRFCRATGAVAIVKLQAPQPDELGFAKQVGFDCCRFHIICTSRAVYCDLH